MSFEALALRARAANDTTRAQINNIPEKSHFIVLLLLFLQTSPWNLRLNKHRRWCKLVLIEGDAAGIGSVIYPIP